MNLEKSGFAMGSWGPTWLKIDYPSLWRRISVKFIDFSDRWIRFKSSLIYLSHVLIILAITEIDFSHG